MKPHDIEELCNETSERIRILDLKPHPEGGFYRRTFASDVTFTVNSDPFPRPIATAIYYLLPASGVSRLHRIDSDEMWHFYDGQPLTIVELRRGSTHKETVLGRGKDQVSQYVVPKDTWFGALASSSGYSLVGCTVFPGLDFNHFQIGSRNFLHAVFPSSTEVIDIMTLP